MANINQVETAEDEFQIERPLHINGPYPATLSTTHDWFFVNEIRGSDLEADFGYGKAWQSPGAMTFPDMPYAGGWRPIVSLSLNDMTPLRGVWQPAHGFTGNAAHVFDEQYFDKQDPSFPDWIYPNGINLYRNLYKYWRVKKCTVEVQIVNHAGANPSKASTPAGVQLGAASVYGEPLGSLPESSWYPRSGSTSENNFEPYYRFIMNPRCSLLCGGAVLGPAYDVSDNQLDTKGFSHSFAPSLTTVLDFDADRDKPVEDPANLNKLQTWTSTTTVTRQANINQRTVIYASCVTARSGEVTQLGDPCQVFIPGVRLRARITFEWRDLKENGWTYNNVQQASFGQNNLDRYTSSFP